jgi:hypothetical protein
MKNEKKIGTRHRTKANNNKQNKTKQKEKQKRKQKQSIISLYLIKFDDTKGIIRSHNLNDRQYNLAKLKKKNKMRNNGLQYIKQKTKDRETRTLRQIEGELRYSEMNNSSSSTSDTRCVTV